MSTEPPDPQQQIADLTARLAVTERENAVLRQLIGEYRRALYGRRSERVMVDQLDLALGEIEHPELPRPANDTQAGVSASPRRGAQARRNRGALPRHLPRIHVYVGAGRDKLPVLCRCAAPDRGGYPRDPRRHPSTVPGEVHPPATLWLPQLLECRGPGAGTGTAGRGRLCQCRSNRTDRRGQMGLAPAAVPPGPDAGRPGDLHRPVDAGALDGPARLVAGLCPGTIADLL